jgi:hypothetical protein
MNIGGKSYDSGGSIIHSENFYAKALTEKVGKRSRGGCAVFSGIESISPSFIV